MDFTDLGLTIFGGAGVLAQTARRFGLFELLKELVLRHRAKQGQENAFKGPLRDMDLHHPPCRSYRANQAFYALGQIAQALLRAVQFTVLPKRVFAPARHPSGDPLRDAHRRGPAPRPWRRRPDASVRPCDAAPPRGCASPSGADTRPKRRNRSPPKPSGPPSAAPRTRESPNSAIGDRPNPFNPLHHRLIRGLRSIRLQERPSTAWRVARRSKQVPIVLRFAGDAILAFCPECAEIGDPPHQFQISAIMVFADQQLGGSLWASPGLAAQFGCSGKKGSSPCREIVIHFVHQNATHLAFERPIIASGTKLRVAYYIVDGARVTGRMGSGTFASGN